MWVKKIVIPVNRYAFRTSEVVFFLNAENKAYYEQLGIISKHQRTKVVRGSGVNLARFPQSPLPEGHETFLYVGRILKDKGIDEFIEAARSVKRQHPETVFALLGPFEEDRYKKIIADAEKEGIVQKKIYTSAISV